MTTQIMTGNELIIQGGLEAGFSLYTGYPGSPLADYFNILNHKKNEMQKKESVLLSETRKQMLLQWQVEQNKPEEILCLL